MGMPPQSLLKIKRIIIITSAHVGMALALSPGMRTSVTQLTATQRHKNRMIGPGYFQMPAFAICAVCALLAMAGCAPKVPPVSTISPQPDVSARLDAMAAKQAALDSQQESQTNAMIALQEHMAALEDRITVLEQRLDTSKAASPKEVPRLKQAATKSVAPHAPLHTPPHASAVHAKPASAVLHAPAIKPSAHVAVAQPTPAVPDPEDARRQQDYDAALLSLKHGDYDKAAKALARFIRRYPRGKHTPQAHYWLGEARFAEENFAQVNGALRWFESEPVSTPMRAPALFRLGTSYQRTGQNADAIRAFEILRRDYPASSEAANAARQLKKLGSDRPAPIAPKPVSPAPEKAKTSILEKHHARKWAVNIVSLDKLAEAKHTLARLHAEGIHAEMMDVRVKGKLWHRLRTIGYASREAADKALRKFVKKGYGDAWTSPE